RRGRTTQEDDGIGFGFKSVLQDAAPNEPNLGSRTKPIFGSFGDWPAWARRGLENARRAGGGLRRAFCRGDEQRFPDVFAEPSVALPLGLVKHLVEGRLVGKVRVGRGVTSRVGRLIAGARSL